VSVCSAVPVPVSVTFITPTLTPSLPTASLGTWSVAVRAPVALGSNAILVVQLWLTVTVVPEHGSELVVKSAALAPATVSAPSCSGAVPVLEIVTGWAVLGSPTS
jgi:hypothetical protein